MPNALLAFFPNLVCIIYIRHKKLFKNQIEILRHYREFDITFDFNVNSRQMNYICFFNKAIIDLTPARDIYMICNF